MIYNDDYFKYRIMVNKFVDIEVLMLSFVVGIFRICWFIRFFWRIRR